MTRVLVTWGSKRGGTEGIARILGEALQNEGLEVTLLPPRQARYATGFDAVVVGGALYANRWHRAARRFVKHRAAELRRVPVWFFSSGPLDDSASRGAIPPTEQVQALMQRVGAQGHATFGGRLAPDARGFPASAMAKKRAGDFRDPERIRAWAREIARALPAAVPPDAPGSRAAPPHGRHVDTLGGAALSLAVVVALLVASPLGKDLPLGPRRAGPWIAAAILSVSAVAAVALARRRRRPIELGRNTLLDELIADCEFSGTVSVPVQARAADLFRALGEVTFGEIPLARALGELRYLPGRLLGHDPDGAAAGEPFLEHLFAGGTVVLAEWPGRELVLGGIGKYHQLLDQEPLYLYDADDFRKFDDPRYQKLAMSLRVEEATDGRRLVLEHRTHPLSERSRRAFARYWTVIGPAGNFVSWLLLRAVRRRAQPASSRRASRLPGAAQGSPETLVDRAKS